MRSWTRLSTVVLAAALVLSGCGNYSTEDLRFLTALPQREDLAFQVPASPSGALSACPPANASVWLEAKPTSDRINAGVDFLISMVDVVRRLEPTAREEDARRWGPFEDRKHPGREIQVIMARTYPDELVGAPRYGYAFQARVRGTPDFTTVMWGVFDGGSASHGAGGMVLYFDQMVALGLGDDTTPAGTMQIAYDRAGDPITTQLVLSNGGFGAEGQFFYRSAAWAAGGGVFDFAIRDGSGNLLSIGTRYDRYAAGQATVAVQLAGGGTAAFQQCWGANACLVYVLDPLNISCPQADQPCNYGVETDCPDPLPTSPF